VGLRQDIKEDRPMRFLSWLLLLIVGILSPATAEDAAQCAPGFVWRDSFPGDSLCVTPAERAAAKRAPKPVKTTGKRKLQTPSGDTSAESKNNNANASGGEGGPGSTFFTDIQPFAGKINGGGSPPRSKGGNDE
jgi:hypothetical protein